jgi:hypothetical protein
LSYIYVWTGEIEIRNILNHKQNYVQNLFLS